MILTDIRIEFPKAVYTIPIRSKYTVLTGNGAIGKSSMLKLDWTDAMISKHVLRFISLDEPTTAYLKSGASAIYIVDEDQMRRIKTADIPLLHRSACQFLFICRDVDDRFPVDYRDVLTIHQSGKYYTAVRLYPDLDTFVPHGSYLCEDKKSGYQYFSSKFKNVRTAKGKDNIPKVVSNDDLVIADGAAFGRLIQILYDKYDLYLPISFEYLCCRAIKPTHPIVSNLSYRDIDPSVYQSLEQLYTKVLASMCKQFGVTYSKSKCPEFIKNMDLVQQDR